MKRVFVLALVTSLVLTLSFATVASAGRPPPDPFVGAWWSVDTDGSNQKLVIAPVRRHPEKYIIIYTDDAASVCGCDTDCPALCGALGRGTASALGTTLTGGFDLWCQGPPPYYYDWVDFVMEYDAVADTLTDEWVTWHRMGGK